MGLTTLNSPLGYCIPTLAEDGQPFQQWNGSTCFQGNTGWYWRGPGGYANPGPYARYVYKGEPSKSTSEPITVYGNGSLNCIQITAAQLQELYWRAKRITTTIVPTGGAISPFGGKISSTFYTLEEECVSYMDYGEGYVMCDQGHYFPGSATLSAASQPIGCGSGHVLPYTTFYSFGYQPNLSYSVGLDLFFFYNTATADGTPIYAQASAAAINFGGMNVISTQGIPTQPKEYWLRPDFGYYAQTAYYTGEDGTYQIPQ